MLILYFSLVWAICWRLRGGAFTTITGLNPGTDGARLFGILPFLGLEYLANWHVAATGAILLFLGIITTGWGPFQGMGTVTANPEPSWLRWLPTHLGLKENTLAHDFIGMAEAGLLCVLPLALGTAFLSWQASILVCIGGLSFSLAYLLARLPLPTIPRFAEAQAWGEVFVGAILGGTISWCFMSLN